MSGLFEILGLPHYAYLAIALTLALAAALIPRRFATRILILGGTAAVIGCGVLVYLFRGGTVFQLPPEQAALYFGRAGLIGAGVLAGLLARHSFAAFFSRLHSLSSTKTPKRPRGSGEPLPKNDLIEGVAFACLLSVLCGIVLVQRPVNTAILYWLAYVIACGVSIALPARDRALNTEGLKNVFVVSLPPAVVLFLVLLFELLAPLLWGIGELYIVSSTDPARVMRISSAWRIFWFYLVIGLASVAAIAIAVFARTRVVSLITQLFALDPDRFSRVEKVVNSVIRIGAAIGGIFIVAKSS